VGILGGVIPAPPPSRPAASPRQTVAVIGAGFSGVLTAVHLLRAPDGPRVVLIERGRRFARGPAYATASPQHLLNVRGANMSALPDAPNHFLDWLGVGAEEGERVFVTRGRYGEYLQSLLRQAAADGAGRLHFEHDAAVGVARVGEGWSVTLAMGRAVTVDAVVAAIGNLPPATPAGLDPAAAASGRWVADPWAWIEESPRVPGDVLLIGAGLTAVDVALTIQERTPGARILALSRHGLAPQAHAPLEAPRLATPPPSQGDVARVFHEVRQAAREDWRAAIDALRPHVQSLWRGWDLTQRRRFLRHLRPWWEVARHRLAPPVAARIDALREAGLFAIAAGRLTRLTPTPDGLEATWSPRGGGAPVRRVFALAVNCSGPLSDVAQSDDPLVAGLLAAGLARPDACQLGLEVDEQSRLVGAGGRVCDRLFAVGPLTRGQVWEMTAAPDIRLQAAQVAGALVARLAETSARPPRQGREALAGDLRAYIDEVIAEVNLEIGAKTAARRARSAWELRGRRAALEDLAAWLDARDGGPPS
jgi:uncharacterized NAD(P)/FAD-binding protein YdhS